MDYFSVFTHMLLAKGLTHTTSFVLIKLISNLNFSTFPPSLSLPKTLPGSS